MNLFTPLVPPEKQHPNFRAMLLRDNRFELDVIRKWSEGFVDRDRKFVKEFQTTFNSCFWELYLFACFKELGGSVNFNFPAPDFLVTLKGTSFIAEATIASHASGYAPEWERETALETLDQLDLSVIVSYSAIRLANAISGKHKKFKEAYAELGHVKNRPFVLCIATFEQPFFFVQNTHAIRRVLYSYDQPLVVKLPDRDKTVIVGEAWAESEVKESGAEVQLGYFTNDGMREISAVLFSTTATYGKVQALRADADAPIVFYAARHNPQSTAPTVISQLKRDYREALLDGLHICINPFAENPLDTRLFEGHPVAFHSYNPYEGAYEVYASKDFLLQRMTMIADPVTPQFREFSRSRSKRTYKEPKPTELPDGVLFSVPGVAMVFTDTHMAFYKDWTILVAYDTVDGEWMAQAQRGRYRTLPDYMAANSKQPQGPLIVERVFPSKEEAFFAAVTEIDEFRRAV